MVQPEAGEKIPQDMLQLTHEMQELKKYFNKEIKGK